MNIDLHPLTILLSLTLFLCGRFNYFIIIFIIILFHDLGHILTMKLFNINISKIRILPFGSIIISDIKYNEKSLIKFLIAISGILFQIILFLIFNISFNIGFINHLTLNIFNKYNTFIIIFNLLPIVPLDGSKIIESVLENIFYYKIAIYLKNIISFVCLIVLLFYNGLSLDLLNILFISIYTSYEEILNIKFIYNKFLLERYLYKYKYRKIKYVSNINKMYKNRLNFINNVSEEKILKNLK